MDFEEMHAFIPETNSDTEFSFELFTKTGGIRKRKKFKMDLNKNLPNQPYTYERPKMGKSNIDVTLATSDIGSNVKFWSVLDITDSDY